MIASLIFDTSQKSGITPSLAFFCPTVRKMRHLAYFLCNEHAPGNLVGSCCPLRLSSLYVSQADCYIKYVVRGVRKKHIYIYIYTCIWGPCFWTKKMKRTCFLKELREEDGPKSHVACYLLAALESHIQTLLSSGCLTQSFIFNMCAELCMFDRSASSILARESLHAQ